MGEDQDVATLHARFEQVIDHGIDATHHIGV
jgi:hypothetical protein